MKILNSYYFYPFRLNLITQFLTILGVFLWLFLPLISKAQSAKTYTPLGKSLQTLPLDTVLVKLDDATLEMNGTNDAKIKQELMMTLARAKATHNPLYIAKANQLIASWHYRSISSENKDSIYHYDNQALMFFLKTNEKELIARACRTLGMDLDEMQKYARAEVAYFKGLKIAQSIGFQSGINSIHSSLSILYLNTKDFDSALKYAKIVVEGYEKDKNYHPLIRALINLNDIYLQLGQPEKSLEAINKAYSLISKLPQGSQISETLNVRSWRAKIYRTLKRYDEALEDYMFSWKGVQQKYGADKANGWKGGIGSIYHLQGKHAEAVPYLRDYIHHFKGKKVNNPEELAQHNSWMAESLKALGQTDSAYTYMASGKDIEINVLQEETKSLKNELRIKYETEQKDQTIASQSGQIEQQNKIQLLSYAIVGLLILLLGGLFFTYRHNQKKNFQLQALNHNLETTNLHLDKRNAENELLLKEIHHRVKNNLEVISSLLALQSAKMDDPDMQEAMLASQNRVQSMGILHQKLYQSEHLAFIEMKNYFQNLCENILDSYNETERIKVNIEMNEVELDIDTAVPVGLIVNELLTNSLKYAFPAGKKGEIKLSLETIDSHILKLKIADNGVGKSLDSLPKGTGFGTQLVDLLTRQIDGKLVQEVDNGTLISINFKRQMVA
jgi:two-component sensor histidine kinase